MFFFGSPGHEMMMNPMDYVITYFTHPGKPVQ